VDVGAFNIVARVKWDDEIHIEISAHLENGLAVRELQLRTTGSILMAQIHSPEKEGTVRTLEGRAILIYRGSQ
jgi:hypothetical protein